MSIAASIRSQMAPIHPEGYPFIGAFALASLILFWLWSPLGWLGTVLTLWCVYFFRDPSRVTPVRDTSHSLRRRIVRRADPQRRQRAKVTWMTPLSATSDVTV